jgi:nifR3 family TIM-barrel protein
MNINGTKAFSPALQAKIDLLKKRRTPIKMGSVSFDSKLLFAPLSAISIAPFRQMMEELGAGGTVSELISCHGINYKNQKTIQMLKLFPNEKNVGIQLFGEDQESMALAAKVAQDSGPKFLDINMGCPVRKVVTKGGGSALLRDTAKLGQFFNSIKSAIDIPLTIKIRTGWDSDDINAPEVIRIAKEEGIEFVAVHGRTRTQQYKGKADWELLEKLAVESPLPIIGNGDLHTPNLVRNRLATSKCDALMLGRGPLRNPFIFLESLLTEEDDIRFTPADYWEVIQHFYGYLEAYTDRERTLLVQMRKHIVWFSQGFQNVATFRNTIFKTADIHETMKVTEDYFLSLNNSQKQINPDESFMAGGHG